MRTAIFGGTFDPIHSAHLVVAHEAAEAFALDRVLFIPAANPPHKEAGAPYEDRFRMVELACAADPRFVPSRLEEGRPYRPSEMPGTQEPSSLHDAGTAPPQPSDMSGTREPSSLHAAGTGPPQPSDMSGTREPSSLHAAGTAPPRPSDMSGTREPSSLHAAGTAPPRPSETPGTREHSSEAASVMPSSLHAAGTAPPRPSKMAGAQEHSAEAASVMPASLHAAGAAPPRPSETPGTQERSAEAGSVVPSSLQEKSYSIHTIERLRAPGESLFFIIGADAFAEIRSWRRWEDVVAGVEFIVVTRPGHVYDSPPGARVCRLETIALPVSSSEIRQELSKGGTPLDLPPAVAEYIHAHGLYRSPQV